MNGLIWTIYGVILLYFALGGAGFYVINRKRPKAEARKSYLKYFTYFAIINIVFLSIVFPPLFRYLTLVVIGAGYYELWRSGRQKAAANRPGTPAGWVILFSLFFVGFYLFSGLPSDTVLYVFMITSIFDSFSQISGQLWGRRKILPRISPNKTLGGTVGGGMIAFGSGFLLNSLYEGTESERLILTAGVIVFSFAGDALASGYKRWCGIKDFSRLIPGHGGVLDRFDSLIAAGSWSVLYLSAILYMNI